MNILEKPAGDGIWIHNVCLDSWKDLVDFGFWGKSENWETKGSGRRRGWVQRWCSRVAGERKTEFGYFACEKRKAACKWSASRQEKWWVVVRIYDVGVCWLFAKNVWGYRRLKIRGWSSSLFLEDRMSMCYWFPRDLRHCLRFQVWFLLSLFVFFSFMRYVKIYVSFWSHVKTAFRIVSFVWLYRMQCKMQLKVLLPALRFSMCFISAEHRYSLIWANVNVRCCLLV